jgi:general secretion pathway protein B
MSYILEALKKAQAERQLGNAPTIHAPAPSYAAPRAGQGAQRRYLALGVGVVVVAAAVALLWPRFAGEQPVRLATVTPPAVVPVTAPATVPATAPVATPAPPAAVIPPPAPVVPPAPAPVAEVRPVRVKPAPAPVVSTASSSPQPPAQQREAPAPATVAPQPVGDDQLRTLQQLPDTLQREIPKVAFGGYIYSPTPGESLLLVDKMLRREGEEVAPGLVLERLTPKAAVMNYRGTRYRAAY